MSGNRQYTTHSGNYGTRIEQKKRRRRSFRVWARDGTLLKSFARATAHSVAFLWGASFSKTLKGHRSPVWEVAISPDGHTLATASRDDTIKLWTSDGRLLKTFKGNTRGVMAVDFSPDGQMLVAGGSTGALKLWKTDGTEITALTSVVY